MNNLETRKVHISQLNPAAYNPRKDLKPTDVEYQRLERSIEEFGYIVPIVWNEATGNVVGGHQRLKILLDKGVTEVEVSVVNLDAMQEKALNLALNKIAGEWDTDLLEELLTELSTEIDLTITGFSEKELESILGEIVIDELDTNAGDNSSSFNYKEQYGVIVMCKDETDQEKVYNFLREQGYDCKVVAT